MEPRVRAGALFAAMALAATGCAVSSTATFTLDGTKHRPSSVRCSASGETYFVELRSPTDTVRLSVVDGLPFDEVTVRVEQPGRPALGAALRAGVGTMSVQRAGMRFQIKAGAVPVDPAGAALASSAAPVPFSMDVQCAQIYGAPRNF